MAQLEAAAALVALERVVDLEAEVAALKTKLNEFIEAYNEHNHEEDRDGGGYVRSLSRDERIPQLP